MTAIDRGRRRTVSRLARGMLIGAGGVALAVGGAGDARATNLGSEGVSGIAGTRSGVFLTDSRQWSVGYRNLEYTTEDAAIDAIEESYQPTDLTVTHGSSPSCADASFDTCVYDDDYGDNGLYGWNACAGTTSGAHPNRRCSLTYVKINLHYNSIPKRVACHELGHSVGLRHSTELGSCMVEGEWPFDRLSAHDQAHINATY
jgi:hypothetical protein